MIPMHRTRLSIRTVTSFAWVLPMVVATVANAAQTDQQKCAAAVYNILGKAAACRYKVEANFFKTADLEKRTIGAAACKSKLETAAAKTLAKYGAGPCPGIDPAPELTSTFGLLGEWLFTPAWAQSGSQYSIVEDEYGNVIGQVAGNGISVEMDGINDGVFSGVYETDAPLVHPAGTHFLPNAEETTATDSTTHLEWEIKTTGGGPRDVSNTYPILGACVCLGCGQPPNTKCMRQADCVLGANCVFQADPSAVVAGRYTDNLNAQNFAGHSDWRLPTYAELYALKRQPCVAFGIPCTSMPGPTAVGSASFPPDQYVSSTPNPTSPTDEVLALSYHSNPDSGVLSTFDFGVPGGINNGYVRAVRDVVP